MWILDHKEGWVLKNWCFWTVVLEKTLESLLDCKDIKPVNPKGNQSWIFTGRTDVKLKLQYFGHLMRRTDSLERPWCWERLKARGKGDDRGWDGWMSSPTQWTWGWLNSGSWWWTGRPGVLQSMGHKELDTTEWLHWTEWFRWKTLFYPKFITIPFSYTCSKNLKIFCFTFTSLIHVELIFMCDLK